MPRLGRRVWGYAKPPRPAAAVPHRQLRPPPLGPRCVGGTGWADGISHRIGVNGRCRQRQQCRDGHGCRARPVVHQPHPPPVGQTVFLVLVSTLAHLAETAPSGRLLLNRGAKPRPCPAIDNGRRCYHRRKTLSGLQTSAALCHCHRPEWTGFCRVWRVRSWLLSSSSKRVDDED